MKSTRPLIECIVNSDNPKLQFLSLPSLDLEGHVLTVEIEWLVSIDLDLIPRMVERFPQIKHVVIKVFKLPGKVDAIKAMLQEVVNDGQRKDRSAKFVVYESLTERSKSKTVYYY